MRIAPLLLSLMMLACTGLFAQDQTQTAKPRFGEMAKGTITHELGINSTFFIANFISFSGNIPTLVSPYALTYKVFRGRHGFRMGLGANYRGEADNSLGGTSSFESTVSLVDVRIGYEFQLPIARRWNLFFGADMVYTYSNSKQTNASDFDRVTTQTEGSSIGGGLIVGIQFFINERISLGTETTCYFKASNEENTTTQQSFPDFNTSTNSTLTAFSFVPPTSIFLNIRFSKSK